MRITNEIRNGIVDELILRGFGEQQKRLRDRDHELADKLYRQKYPAAFEKQCDALDQAWRELGNNHGFISQATSLRTAFEGTWHHFALAHRRPCIDSQSISFSLKDNPLADEVHALIGDRASLDSQVKMRRAEALAVLNKAYTLKTLRAIWPEVVPIAEKVLKDHGVEAPKNVLVLATDDLNSTFGLPVEEQVAA